MKPVLQTDHLEPASIAVSVGHLSVVARGPTAKDAKVMLDGKPMPVKRIVIEIDVDKPTTVTMEWYPGFEFRRDAAGSTFLGPIDPIAADTPATVHTGRPSESHV